jgi:hypothetical protein
VTKSINRQVVTISATTRAVIDLPDGSRVEISMNPTRYGFLSISAPRDVSIIRAELVGRRTPSPSITQADRRPVKLLERTNTPTKKAG